MFHDEQHPDVTLSNWETFRREYSNFLLEEVVDRSEIKLPDWSVPLARGAAFPSSHLLRKAGYRLGSRRADGWSKPHHDVLWKDIGGDSLVVRGYCNQPLWSIERNGSTGSSTQPPEQDVGPPFRVDANSCPKLSVSDVSGRILFPEWPAIRAALGRRMSRRRAGRD